MAGMSEHLPALMALLGVALVLLLGPTAWLLHPWWQARRRERLRAQPFPAAWRRILRRRVPLVARLPAPLQLRLKRHMQVFLAEKPLIGCQGLVVDDDMRVAVAAQACLLLLGHERPDYFPGLRQVLLYPGAFVVDRVQAVGAGVQQDQRRVLAGESWQQGQVILSWADVVQGGAIADDGRNVVLHEFAHQLDQQTGAANGAPAQGHPALARRWAQVMGAAYAQLHHTLAQGLPSVLSDYGATDEAEFFAVATEVFFEQPEALATEYPDLYGELSRHYRLMPLRW